MTYVMWRKIMLKTFSKILATSIVVASAFMAIYNWNTPLGVVWMIAGIGWLNVLIERIDNERLQSRTETSST